MLRFGKARAGVVIDVLVVVAARLAVGVKGEAGGLEEHGAGFMYENAGRLCCNVHVVLLWCAKAHLW